MVLEVVFNELKKRSFCKGGKTINGSISVFVKDPKKVFYVKRGTNVFIMYK